MLSETKWSRSIAIASLIRITDAVDMLRLRGRQMSMTAFLQAQFNRLE
ncbi:hypothetical protein HNP98_000610 [Hymenobacter sp. 9A]|uniref:Uncharacterized protein n=1 Tax=Hymenobacter caeli TaxID=2735894 RepID=A0ABX2FL07_9BACT|nr:hypothetical protein [Hymenobacter caeli]